MEPESDQGNTWRARGSTQASRQRAVLLREEARDRHNAHHVPQVRATALPRRHPRRAAHSAAAAFNSKAVTLK